MEKFNEFFKNLAVTMKLPDFFQGNTLVVNNLFLVLLGLVLVIALVLVIVLVPGKKKKSKAYENAPEAASEAESEEPAAEVSAKEESPLDESVLSDLSEEEPAKEETLAEEPVAPSEEEKQEPAEAPAPEVKEEAPAEKEVLAAKAAPAPKKEDEQGVKTVGKYEIIRRMGNYHFLLKANNGQLLMESSGYTTEQGAKKAIDTFKNAVEVGEFRIDEDKNGNYKFVLRASARSQMLYYGESYRTRQSAEGAIQSLKYFAFNSVVKKSADSDPDGDAAENATVLVTTPFKAADYKVGGKYEIEERNGSYYFLLKANNGQLLLESPAFTTEQGAKNGIDSFKKAAESGVFMIYQDKNGKFKFILRASTRAQMRYYGEGYSTRQSAENSVKSVRAFAAKAEIKA